jgi:hypothetical protein
MDEQGKSRANQPGTLVFEGDSLVGLSVFGPPVEYRW